GRPRPGAREPGHQDDVDDQEDQSEQEGEEVGAAAELGATSTSWNTAATPASIAARGEGKRTRACPSSSRPASGWRIVDKSRTRVRGRDTISRKRQSITPGRSSTDADRMACVGPKDLAMPVARSRVQPGSAE